MLTPILYIFLGSCILFIPLLFIFRPARQINNVYGYRTKLSMKNEDAWKYANLYWPRILLKLSLFTLSFQIGLLIFFGFLISILATSAIWIIMLGLSIIMTEEKLKKL